MDITDKLFEEVINASMAELPEEQIKNLNNVAITFDDEPSALQREKLKLRSSQTLFGLYEGIPLIARGAGYNMVLPDKITLFKLPLLHASRSVEEFKKNVKHTLWHEIAHHYGLDHSQIEKLENK